MNTYNREQLIEAMTQYYQNFIDHPDEYVDAYSQVIPAVDAIQVIDVLIATMEGK